ncbi:hypothetical protein [Lentzea flaviverrucosa]|uniref:hypothetical protein n=1 Tax=Lentzea flaviverrucosa TaxID=200379 RepID=UPI0011609EB7|nr:hypothetical protein [Lentzea flaviverrucosa]
MLNNLSSVLAEIGRPRQAIRQLEASQTGPSTIRRHTPSAVPLHHQAPKPPTGQNSLQDTDRVTGAVEEREWCDRASCDENR